jgi:hypothetical protein
VLSGSFGGFKAIENLLGGGGVASGNRDVCPEFSKSKGNCISKIVYDVLLDAPMPCVPPVTRTFFPLRSLFKFCSYN